MSLAWFYLNVLPSTSGLLNVGDVIRQINGEKVGENLKEVQEKLVCVFPNIPVLKSV